MWTVGRARGAAGKPVVNAKQSGDLDEGGRCSGGGGDGEKLDRLGTCPHFALAAVCGERCKNDWVDARWRH